MTDQEFMEWYWGDAPEQDKKLHNKMCEFEEYFEDMIYDPGFSSFNLIKCQSKLPGSDEWIDDEAPRPEALEYFSYNMVRTEVKDLENCEGYYDHKNKVLCLDTKLADDDSSLLHEMIHLHEGVINDLPLYFHDMLYWALYSDLRNKIVGLDDAISSHAHILNESTIYSSGGLHDILFLLKSFDLDIRMGYPFGTVFAYGRVEDFKNLKLKIDTI